MRGAHAVEVDAPARWLGPDWIMLTTGVRLRGNAEAQRALVPQLQAEGVRALGFGIGLGFKRVPPALVEVARARGFPVFAVPYETPFREIIHFVDSSLTSGEEQVFRRLTALQRYLVDALRTPQPERAMVDRLAQFLDASVLLLERRGRGPRSSPGKPPVAELLKAVCGQPPGLARAQGRRLVRGRDAGRERADQPARWLVLASRRPAFISKLAKPAAEATAPLLAAMACLGDVVRDQEQAVKAALLEEALEPAEAHDLLPLAARAAAFGLDFRRPARLVIIRRHPRRGDARAPRSRRRAPRAGRRARSLQRPTPRPEAGGLDQRAHPGRRQRDRRRSHRGGRSPPRRGHRRRALRSRRSSRPTTRCATPSWRSIAAVWTPNDRSCASRTSTSARSRSREIPPERLGPKVDEILSVLRANQPLHEALTAYFAHDLDIAATAAALHMGTSNSLRYRLARAEQVLGRSLKQPSTIAAIYIALVADAADQSRAASLD